MLRWPHVYVEEANIVYFYYLFNLNFPINKRTNINNPNHMKIIFHSHKNSLFGLKYSLFEFLLIKKWFENFFYSNNLFTISSNIIKYKKKKNPQKKNINNLFTISSNTIKYKKKNPQKKHSNLFTISSNTIKYKKKSAKKILTISSLSLLTQ